MNKRKFIPVAVALVAIIAVSGVAYAYWTASGSGTGHGSTAAGVSNLTATSAGLNDMYPGDSPQDIVITVHNPSTQTVYVTSVAVAVTGTEDPITHLANSNCGTADFTITGPAAVGQQILAGQDLVLARSIVSPVFTPPTIQFKNDPGRSQNACKSMTVNLGITIS